MRNRHWYTALSAAVLFASASQGATSECTPGYIDGNELNDRIDRATQSVLNTHLESRGLPKEQLFKSIGPPPSSNGSKLVDGASFTDFVAVGVENELLKGSDAQTTLQLSPFAWYAALDPTILNDADRYNAHTFSRRFALTFGTGGQGEKFDRTGDGTADDPLKSDDFDDIQTWELKYRLFGSRDYKENLDELRAAATEAAVLAKLRANVALGLARGLQRDAANCVRAELVESYLASSATQSNLLELAEATLQTNKRYANRLERIATRWTSSLVAATTQQEPEFGQDKWSAGLRVSWGGDARAVNLNLDYSQANGRATLPDPNSWKVGAEYVTYLLPGKLGKKGVKTALSAVWEMFDDIPTAKHDDVGKVGVRFEIPIAGSDAVKLPISLIWANHKDALTDADSVRGHVGFTVDFGEALKKQKAGK